MSVLMAIMSDWSHLQILDQSSVLQVYSYSTQWEISVEVVRESHRNMAVVLLDNERQLVGHGIFSADWNRSDASATDRQFVAHTDPMPNEHVYSIARNAKRMSLLSSIVIVIFAPVLPAGYRVWSDWHTSAHRQRILFDSNIYDRRVTEHIGVNSKSQRNPTYLWRQGDEFQWKTIVILFLTGGRFEFD